ncbi:MAG: hypothetical protein ACTSV5_02400 [Promethearchaeota archaeon]
MDAIALRKLKCNIKRVINDFIFSNPYNRKYIGIDASSTPYQLAYARDRFEIMQSLWVIASIIEGDPKISFKRATKALGLKTFINRFFNTENRKLTNKMCNRILGALLTAFDEQATLGADSRMLGLIYISLVQLSKFMSKQDYKLVNMRGIIEVARNQWKKEYTMASHVMMGFMRHLGFDPITFELIDDAIFNQAAFARYEYDVKSFLILDQVLTSRKNHPKWNALRGRGRIITEAFEILINYKGDVDRTIIDNLFNNEKYEWFYSEVVQSNWYNNPDFNFDVDLLPRFNSMRGEFQRLGPEAYIANRFPIAYDRFYTKAFGNKKNRALTYHLLNKLHDIDKKTKLVDNYATSRDLNLFNNIDFMQIFKDILTQFGYKLP